LAFNNIIPSYGIDEALLNIKVTAMQTLGDEARYDGYNGAAEEMMRLSMS